MHTIKSEDIFLIFGTPYSASNATSRDVSRRRTTSLVLSTKPISPLDVLGDGGDELLSVDHDPLNEGAVGKKVNKLSDGVPQ